jgi:hypothetical protein
MVSDCALASRYIEDDVTIGYTDDPVIDDDGRGDMRFKMINVGNETQRFALAFIPQDPTHLDGYFKRTLVTVPPLDEEAVVLVVTVSEGTDVEEVGGFAVRIDWGRDLELEDGVVPIPETVEGSWERTFKVHEDEGPTLGAGPLTVIAAVAVVALLIIMVPAWMDRRSSRRR